MTTTRRSVCPTDTGSADDWTAATGDIVHDVFGRDIRHDPEQPASVPNSSSLPLFSEAERGSETCSHVDTLRCADRSPQHLVVRRARLPIRSATCDGCAITFIYAPRWWGHIRRYCSKSCVARWGRWRERQTRQFRCCFGCGRCFLPTTKHPEQGSCSRTCAAILRNEARQIALGRVVA